MAEKIDIVAIKGGHVVAMAYSDDGCEGDREFIADHPPPDYTIDYMPVSEAVAKHLSYLREIGFITSTGAAQ